MLEKKHQDLRPLVYVNTDTRLDEEDVVNLVLTPRGIGTMRDSVGRVVVKPCQELERLDRYVFR